MPRQPSLGRLIRLGSRAGAAGAFAIFLAACGDDDDETAGGGGQTDTQQDDAASGDLAIVQYALTLEHLETDFYNAVIEAGVITDKALAETAMMIRDNEQEHVDALTATVEDLGGTPEKPKTNFDSVLQGGPDMVLETAATVENLGAAAYLGQAGRIQSKEILAAALSIHSVEVATRPRSTRSSARRSSPTAPSPSPPRWTRCCRRSSRSSPERGRKELHRCSTYNQLRDRHSSCAGRSQRARSTAPARPARS